MIKNEKWDDRRVIHVNKELHKRIKMYCLSHEIKSMADWVEPILEAAIKKPSAKERLEKQAAETPLEAVVEIDAEVEGKNDAAGELVTRAILTNEPKVNGQNSPSMIDILA